MTMSTDDADDVTKHFINVYATATVLWFSEHRLHEE